jgi:hypothetical protein
MHAARVYRETDRVAVALGAVHNIRPIVPPKRVVSLIEAVAKDNYGA